MKLAAFVLTFILASWTLALPAQEAAAPTYEATMNTGSLYGTVDVECILRTWRITGVFACTHGAHRRRHRLLRLQQSHTGPGPEDSGLQGR